MMIPARTVVTVRILVGAATTSVAINDDSVYVYRCIDCEFKTADLETMLAHQRRPRHTWWQSIRRFFGGSAI